MQRLQSSLLKLLLLLGVFAAIVGAAPPQRLCTIDVPAGNAETTLRLLGRQANVQLIFDAKVVSGFQTHPVRGRFTVEGALRELLAGLPLTWVSDPLTDAYAIQKKSASAVMEKDPRRVLHAAPDSGSGPPPPPTSMQSPAHTSDSSRPRRTRFLALLALLATKPAGAETDAASAAANNQHPQDVLQLDEFVVTGTPRGARKFDSAFSISTVSAEKIERAAPVGTVDLVRTLPGFATEPSGGESGNNVAVRGLPTTNFRFVGLFEDGLPNFHEQQQDFINADELMRVDATIEGVEAVRGGTASIFSSNSPGANVNFLTKKGTPVREGLARLTMTDYAQIRWDAVASGPVSEGLSGSIGGFYRVDDGLRDPGFTANKGGQIRASLTRTFEGGGVTAYVKRLDDRNIFYLPIPLKDPRNPSVSLAGLIDPRKGTLTSADFRHARIRTLDGTTNGRTFDADLADGIHPDMITAGIMANFKFGDGWQLTEHFRFASGDVGFNAMLSIFAPDDATTFLAEQLARAQAGFGPTVTSARYVFANVRNADGSRVAFDPATTGGLVIRGGWWSTPSSIENALNDLRLSKTFGRGVGRHDVTVGLYLADYSFEQTRYWNTNLMELRDRPRALDIEALDANGNVVGSVTENGFLQYGTNGDVGGRVDGKAWAPYIADTYQLTQALRLDAGLRLYRQEDRGFARLLGIQNLGDPNTLADDNVAGDSGLVENRSATYDATSWTIGANFELTPSLGFFGRYTSTFRTPNQGNIYLRQSTPVTDIDEVELGAKFKSRTFAFFATAFGNRFTPLVDSISIPDESGAFQNVPFKSNTETYGLEVEAAWSPLSFFELSGNVTWQNPEYKDLVDTRTGAAVPGIAGNQLSRIPKLVGSLQPKFTFPVAGVRAEVYSTIYHVGERFVDTANNTRLPAYTTIDAGITIHFSERLSLQLVGANLNNSDGLTEGNPRVDSLAGQGTAQAIYARPVFGRNFRSVLTYRF